jgi:hypothetical protein
MRGKISSPVDKWIYIFLIFLGVVQSASASGNDCPAIVPADAMPIGEPRLCRASKDDEQRFYVCRTYRDNQLIYHVVFHGGRSPVAVYVHAVTANQSQETVLTGSRRDVGKRECNLERPVGVPAGAAYRGTGVCEDAQGRPLPCSLYEHAGARQPEALRYFVYYEPEGRGVRHVDVLPAGRNEHALEAEFAFQLGQALRKTGCCHRLAEAYLLHAEALFPDDDRYRAAVIAIGQRDTKRQANPTAASSGKPDLSP